MYFYVKMNLFLGYRMFVQSNPLYFRQKIVSYFLEPYDQDHINILDKVNDLLLFVHIL